VSQPEIAKNSLNPYFWGSLSFKVIDVGTLGKLVSSAIISSKSMSICNRSLARRASEITISYRRHFYLMPWFEGNLLIQRQKKLLLRS